MKTILSHFYNEEFLLPFWLEHHKNYFDHGVLIDYNSTDRSKEIVKDICPTWEVIPTDDDQFIGYSIDRQILNIERRLSGWRIALTTTEFMLGDLDKIIMEGNYPTSGIYNHILQVLQLIEWNPEGTIDRNKKLWEQFTVGVDSRVHYFNRFGRSLHNHNNFTYSAGRHYLTPPTTQEVIILHMANLIACPEMLERRLQIQNKIPNEERQRNAGWQHHNHGRGLSKETLYEQIQEIVTKFPPTDCSQFINSLWETMKNKLS